MRKKKKKSKINKLLLDFSKKEEVKKKNKYEILFEKVLLNTKDLWLPNKSDKKVTLNKTSWFNIEEYKSDEINKPYNAKLKISASKTIMRCDKIKMYPTKLQKILLLNWMNCYVTMYNEAVKLFKYAYDKKQKIPSNWKTLRTDYLKKAKSRIINNSQINTLDIKTKVNAHILDSAIKEACSNYKACLTNWKRGNIRHFRVRYLKYSKPRKVIQIEKNFVSNNTFCSSVFKDDFKLKDDFEMKNINKDFLIHYNSKTEEFYLLNPTEETVEKSHKNKDTVSLDPGIRTFMAGFSNNKCVKICNNLQNTLKKHINCIDKINNNINIPNKKKKQIEQRCYRKIGNLIDDLHWKTIKYLTDNYGNILIGNLSTKEIVKNQITNVLNSMTKRIALLMKLCQFKQRLAYKCTSRRVGYKEIDEAYTTKTCTNCAFKNDNIGGKKIINCQFCKLEIQRDFGGARNIMLRDFGEN